MSISEDSPARYVAQRSSAGWLVISTGTGEVVRRYEMGALGAEQAAAATRTLNRRKALPDSLPNMSPLDLRVWRTRQQLTQGELAVRLGVHINTVNRWENGETAVPPFLPLALDTLERQSRAADSLQHEPDQASPQRRAEQGCR